MRQQRLFPISHVSYVSLNVSAVGWQGYTIELTLSGWAGKGELCSFGGDRLRRF